jgi:hypothetical protein
MWFDANKALAEIGGGALPPSVVEIVKADAPAELAAIAQIARPLPLKPETKNATGRDGLHPDAGALHDHLRLNGPCSYGAAAVAMGWGATRAWQAEARLRAAGMVRLDRLGRATVEGLQ